MSQEHAQRGEIGICQIGQDFAVDGIVAKCLLVLFQAEATQKVVTSTLAVPRRTRPPRECAAPHTACPGRRGAGTRSYRFSQRRMNRAAPGA